MFEYVTIYLFMIVAMQLWKCKKYFEIWGKLFQEYRYYPPFLDVIYWALWNEMPNGLYSSACLVTEFYHAIKYIWLNTDAGIFIGSANNSLE